jgi:hypothetical protein
VVRIRVVLSREEQRHAQDKQRQERAKNREVLEAKRVAEHVAAREKEELREKEEEELRKKEEEEEDKGVEQLEDEQAERLE